jgi:hypothetical protein
MLDALINSVRQYTDNPDPMAKVAGTIALIVASNQPFYPLYLYTIVGKLAWPAWFTLLTTPLFLAIPAVARRHPLVGRAMLPIVGVVNTVLSVKLIGVNTAVELFLLPCVLLAAIIFRPNERMTMIPVLLVPFAAYLLVDGALGAPLQVFDAESYSSIVALHAISVASLTAAIGFLVAAIPSEPRT